MNRFVSFLGWLLFACSLVGVITSTGMDPVTAALRASGWDAAILWGAIAFSAAMLVVSFCLIRGNVKREAKLIVNRAILDALSRGVALDKAIPSTPEEVEAIYRKYRVL